MGPRIAVVGAGSVGMATAVCIQKKLPDAKVVVVAEYFTPDTTGDCAAGLLVPHAVGTTPLHKIRKWMRLSLDRAMSLLLSEEAGAAGVQLINGYDIHTGDIQDNTWTKCVDQMLSFREGTAAERQLFRSCKVKHVRNYHTLLVYSRVHLPWLMSEFRTNGGEFKQRKLKSLSELRDYDVIVNCSGIGAHDLVDDPEVFPIRGQALLVKAPWVKCFYVSNFGEHYIIPTTDGTVVCGGTHQKDNWHRSVNPEDRKAILQGCYQLLPGLKKAPIVGEWAGLRPGRSSIRLEYEEKVYEGKKLKIVHNYGHGGAGVTLSWGCGIEAAELTENALNKCTSKL